MFYSFKRDSESSEATRMTAHSSTPGGRFRVGTVVDATPQTRLEQTLHDGALMFATFQELVGEAGEARDHELVGELARIAGRSPDAQRAYAAQRYAAEVRGGGYPDAEHSYS